MSAIPIRESVRVPRRNRKEDEQTIRVGRMLRSAASSDEQGPEVEALCANMLRHLPRCNLRCLAGALDARLDFRLRFAEAQIAKARWQLHEAEIERIRVLEGNDEAKNHFAENHRLLDIYRVRIMDLATTTAPTKGELAMKRRAIGQVWLRAEGDWYARLRAAIDRDMKQLN